MYSISSYIHVTRHSFYFIKLEGGSELLQKLGISTYTNVVRIIVILLRSQNITAVTDSW